MKNDHSAPKGKEKSDKALDGAKGGSTKMFGQQAVNPSKPGGVSVSAPGSNKFGVSGGKGHMAPQQAVNPSKSGGVSVSAPGSNKWGVEGGKGHMAGYTGAKNARPC